jgi:hypothetical protein
MTIERSTPVGQNNIVQFSAFARAAAAQKAVATSQEAGAMDRYLAERQARREARELIPPATETCRNQRLRLGRRDKWWAASYLTAYWRARLDWESALSFAQTHAIADANSYPKCDADKNRQALVDLGARPS